MDIYPAIDLRGGRVVRLSQGDAARETVYADDPVAQARAFIDQGATWLHVVDLDRAFGTGDNLEAVRSIIAAAGGATRIQCGGGFRTAEAIASALGAGAARVVIGTAAVTDPEVVAWMAERLAPHPWKCFTQPLVLTNEDALWEIPQSVICCTSLLRARGDGPRMARARDAGRVWDIDTGHDLMLTEPQWVADHLTAIAR